MKVIPKASRHDIRNRRTRLVIWNL